MQIKQVWNKQRKCYEWRARFQLRGVEYTPKADTKDELNRLIRAIHSQEETVKLNQRHNLNIPVVQYFPTLRELFDDILPTITHPKQNQIAERVFNDFIALLPPELKVTELTTFHFQLYINDRRKHVGKQTKKPLKPQTINKELFAISGALKKAPQFYESLQNWARPPIPFLKEEDSTRELNLEIEQFHRLLAKLREERTGRQTIYTETHRRRLADELEFRYETGLRRKEVARLQFKQYNEKEGILKNVRRWKTNTVTKIFPLTKRAIELIEERKNSQGGSPYIFTTDGEPVESDYRTLKVVCKKLDIPYGRFAQDGFVPHDLRHAAGTETVLVSDIETAREYLGHSNVKQTIDYLHTNAERLKEAVRRRDEMKGRKADTEKQLKEIYKKVKNGKMPEEKFIENISKLFRF
jgi:integrase